MNIRAGFRVDGSPKIGMGHVMRCLTLANCMSDMGFTCQFICRDLSGSGIKHIESFDFNVQLLAVDTKDLPDTCLNTSVEKDTQDTIAILLENPVDWLIVDHYELDKKWECIIRTQFPGIKIMVIDDLVNRKHDCEILMDQTCERKEQEYRPLVPEHARLCLGTDFALLRPEFARLRSIRNDKKLEDNKLEDNKQCHILITLGGGDISKSLEIVGKALQDVACDHIFSVCAVAGDTPDECLKDFCNLPGDVEIIAFSKDMANEMARADIVIGAAGGTSWERCCLGLPTVLLTLADNQAEIGRVLHEKKAAISVSTDHESIASAVKTLLGDAVLRHELSVNASALCDGKGVSRIVREIMAASLEFRAANIDDARFIYDARYEGGAMQYYRNKHRPEFSEHLEWLSKSLNSDERILTCVSFGSEDIAHVKLDKNSNQTTEGEIGICLSQDWRGKGLGPIVLEEAGRYFATQGITMINAEIHSQNMASIRVFEAAGYSRVSMDCEGFMNYTMRM